MASSSDPNPDRSFSRAALPAELEDFRREIRDFCAANLPEDIRAKVFANQVLDRQDHIRWQKILADKGWFNGFWPVEHGGLGWSPLKRWIFESEVYYHGSPWLVPFGLVYVAPVIYTFGNKEQQERFLPGIRHSDTFWAQGYSEAGAGSDLVAVSMRAERDGDEWVVNGAKLWTTMAQWADMMFAIVRTSPGTKPQHGLSFLLIDLKAPGVTVLPIITIDEDHHVNEVILDNVRVPAANLIGEEGRGWSYAKFLLGNERLLGGGVGRAARLLGELKGLLRTTYTSGRSLAEDKGWRRRVAGIETQLMALESLALSMLSGFEGGVDPGSMASVLKLTGSQLLQSIEGAMVDAIGSAGLGFQTQALDADWNGPHAGPPHAAGMVRDYLHGRASTIYGGSTEVQKNIIAKAVLGL